jgi:hypothetical protein
MAGSSERPAWKHEVLLRAFQPDHDRIVRLGLQYHVTSGIGHDVTIDAADDAVRHALAAGTLNIL